MAIQFSTTLRNSRLDQITTTVGNAALLKIYDGTPPANPAAALSGNTELASLTCATPFASAASGGVLTVGSITTAAALATGTASFFRIYDSGNTTCSVQGSVTATGGGGDLTINTTYLTSGGNVAVTGFTITEGNL
jgi:hypothetical protein